METFLFFPSYGDRYVCKQSAPELADGRRAARSLPRSLRRFFSRGCVWMYLFFVEFFFFVSPGRFSVRRSGRRRPGQAVPARWDGCLPNGRSIR